MTSAATAHPAKLVAYKTPTDPVLILYSLMMYGRRAPILPSLSPATRKPKQQLRSLSLTAFAVGVASTMPGFAVVEVVGGEGGLGCLLLVLLLQV